MEKIKRGHLLQTSHFKENMRIRLHIHYFEIAIKKRRFLINNS